MPPRGYPDVACGLSVTKQRMFVKGGDCSAIRCFRDDRFLLSPVRFFDLSIFAVQTFSAVFCGDGDELLTVLVLNSRFEKDIRPVKCDETVFSGSLIHKKIPGIDPGI